MLFWYFYYTGHRTVLWCYIAPCFLLWEVLTFSMRNNNTFMRCAAPRWEWTSRPEWKRENRAKPMNCLLSLSAEKRWWRGACESHSSGFGVSHGWPFIYHWSGAGYRHIAHWLDAAGGPVALHIHSRARSTAEETHSCANYLYSRSAFR